MNRSNLSLSCAALLAAFCAPVLAADPVQPPEPGYNDRSMQRRAELRQAISAQRQQTPPDIPARTLSDRERAELREQLRRESMAPRDVREPRERPMHLHRP